MPGRTANRIAMSQSILIPLIAVGVLVALAVVVAVALVARDPRAAARRVESLFRKPLGEPKKPGAGHYYKPYWS
jgi:flagellar basal body-associated protein FliL